LELYFQEYSDATKDQDTKRTNICKMAEALN